MITRKKIYTCLALLFCASKAAFCDQENEKNKKEYVIKDIDLKNKKINPGNENKDIVFAINYKILGSEAGQIKWLYNETKVITLKELLEEHHDFPLNQQKLIHEKTGQVLEDNKMLGYYHLKRNDTILVEEKSQDKIDDVTRNDTDSSQRKEKKQYTNNTLYLAESLLRNRESLIIVCTLLFVGYLVVRFTTKKKAQKHHTK